MNLSKQTIEKYVLSFLLFALTFTAKSQYYPGYLQDNYSGIHGVITNPSSIADSRMKADINIISTSSSYGNDFYGAEIFKLILDPKDFIKDDVSKIYNVGAKSAIFSDVMGPSVMFNIAPKHSFGITTRARAFFNFTNVSGDLYNELKGGSNEITEAFNYAANPNIVAHTWGEVGATYAFVLLNKKQHFLKGGFTGKYLVGGANTYLNGQNVTASYDTANNTLVTSGSLETGINQDFFTDDYKYNFNTDSNGFGLDFGFTYEWRPDFEKYDLAKAKPADRAFKDKNKYKLRFGFSVTDLGSITYKSTRFDKYDMTGSFTKSDIENNDGLNDFFPTNHTTSTSDMTVNLPTALHLETDWNILSNLYLNLNGNIGLTSRTSANTSSINNVYMLTPRWETKIYSIYLPVSYSDLNDLQVGTGFRVGPLSLGSSGLISNVIHHTNKPTDVYLGYKIPIYQNHHYDTDNDGVFDHKDKCPDVAGALENKGCPWGDADNDGVTDNLDKCPKKAGTLENNGCPAENKAVAVVVDNDTDKDGVLNDADKCPTEAGTPENGGCPEPAKPETVVEPVASTPTAAITPEKEVIMAKTLETYTYSYEFYFGKATFKPGYQAALNQVVDTMNEYPNNKFNIDGHTDNVGSDSVNIKLSTERANAVMNYLISKGIDKNRLKATGYGSIKPIATNKTPQGRELNRRVEINVSK